VNLVNVVDALQKLVKSNTMAAFPVEKWELHQSKVQKQSQLGVEQLWNSHKAQGWSKGVEGPTKQHSFVLCCLWLCLLQC